MEAVSEIMEAAPLLQIRLPESMQQGKVNVIVIAVADNTTAHRVSRDIASMQTDKAKRIEERRKLLDSLVGIAAGDQLTLDEIKSERLARQ